MVTDKTTISRAALLGAIGAGVAATRSLTAEQVTALVQYAATTDHTGYGAYTCADGTQCPLTATGLDDAGEDMRITVCDSFAFYRAFDRALLDLRIAPDRRIEVI